MESHSNAYCVSLFGHGQVVGKCGCFDSGEVNLPEVNGSSTEMGISSYPQDRVIVMPKVVQTIQRLRQESVMLEGQLAGACLTASKISQARLTSMGIHPN